MGSRRLEVRFVSFCYVTQQQFGVRADHWVYSYGIEPCGQSTPRKSRGSSSV